MNYQIPSEELNILKQNITSQLRTQMVENEKLRKLIENYLKENGLSVPENDLEMAQLYLEHAGLIQMIENTNGNAVELLINKLLKRITIDDSLGYKLETIDGTRRIILDLISTISTPVSDARPIFAPLQRPTEAAAAV